MKTFRFSLVLRTRENTDVFISLDDNIYGIHSKRINILCVSKIADTFLTPPQIYRLWVLAEALLMSVHNIYFHGEIRKI